MFKCAFTAQIFWSVVYVGITVIGKLATPGARLLQGNPYSIEGKPYSG